MADALCTHGLLNDIILHIRVDAGNTEVNGSKTTEESGPVEAEEDDDDDDVGPMPMPEEAGAVTKKRRGQAAVVGSARMSTDGVASCSAPSRKAVPGSPPICRSILEIVYASRYSHPYCRHQVSFPICHGATEALNECSSLEPIS